MDNSNLANRMKTFYEEIPKAKLMRRTPVIIRIDGKAFHTFTEGFYKPFDNVLMETMQNTTKYLCENIQGCVLGYTQSDEISLVLVDYKKLESQAWFDYEVQKMCSIAASMATVAFNKYFAKALDSWYETNSSCMAIPNDDIPVDTEFLGHLQAYCKAKDKGAMFDARCFNIPKEEVTNYIYWRQLDATRNSIQMVGQANFSHRELQNKSCNEIQDMLVTQKNINWNDFPIYQKRGTCVIRSDEMGIVPNGTEVRSRSKWIVDKNIPIFKSENREYIEKLI